MLTMKTPPAYGLSLGLRAPRARVDEGAASWPRWPRRPSGNPGGAARQRRRGRGSAPHDGRLPVKYVVLRHRACMRARAQLRSSGLSRGRLGPTVARRAPRAPAPPESGPHQRCIASADPLAGLSAPARGRVRSGARRGGSQARRAAGGQSRRPRTLRMRLDAIGSSCSRAHATATRSERGRTRRGAARTRWVERGGRCRGRSLGRRLGRNGTYS